MYRSLSLYIYIYIYIMSIYVYIYIYIRLPVAGRHHVHLRALDEAAEGHRRGARGPPVQQRKFWEIPCGPRNSTPRS